jgi:hypothetical protein
MASSFGDHRREALAAGAGLLVLCVGLALRRYGRERDMAVSAIGPGLFVEGHSERNGIGAFSGFAAAMAWAQPGAVTDPQQVMYLVHDPQKPAPVWVRLDEIVSLDVPPGQTTNGGAIGGDQPGARQHVVRELEHLTTLSVDQPDRSDDTSRHGGREGAVDR